MSQPYFILIDGHAVIYRAYHAFKELSTSQGLLINASYGFTKILLTVIRNFRPEYVAVAFDHPTPTFRHEQFVGYKAHREEMPDDLKPQIQIVKDIVTVLNIPQFELAGFEADDVIGTLACQARELQTPEVMTMIVTGDRDSFQLVDDKVHIWMAARNKFQKDTEYDPAAVKDKMGVWPRQIVDLKALMGDASDNIPGVTGIGEKTATKLIQAFDTVEALYAVLDQPEQLAALPADQQALLKKGVVEKLLTGRAQAVMSKSLATIKCDVPLKLDLPACRINSYDKDKAVQLFTELEFKSLVPLLPADEFELGVQSALF